MYNKYIHNMDEIVYVRADASSSGLMAPALREVPVAKYWLFIQHEWYQIGLSWITRQDQVVQYQGTWYQTLSDDALTTMGIKFTH